MAMTVGELVANFDVNTDPARRGILAAELQMRGLQQATDGSIRDMHGNYVSMARDLDDVGQHASQLGNNSRDAHRDLSLLGALSSPLSSLGSSLADVGQKALTAFGYFSAGAGPVSGLIGSLVDIVPAAAIATTALLSVAQAAAVIKIGTSGIGSALKAAFADPTGGGGGGGAGRSAQQLADAERAVTDAQRQELVAQKNLSAARVQAARDLQDMNNQLKDGQLDQRRATLDLQEAQEHLQQVKSTGADADSEQMQEAQLAYDQAKQHLAETTLGQKRLTSDTAAANKAGVNGSQKVRQAQDQLRQSQEAVLRAQEALNQSVGGGGGGAVNALAAALAKLSPSARAFVEEIIALKPALKGLQLDVQQHLFAGLAGSLKGSATVLLPIFRKELVNSATALNTMAKGVLSSAKALGTSGVLGSAMHSASTGLHNLAGVPGLLVTAFGQLAAAAGPQFDKLTKSVGTGAAAIGKSLGAAFKSGGLSEAIDDAVKLIKEIIVIGANLGSVLMSVFRATSQSGGSFLDILKTISGVLKTAFASPAVQSALKALFGVMNALATTAAPLLMQALGVIAPVLTALGPPVKSVIASLGKALSPIIKALGPLLKAAAGAVGALLLALSPLLPVIGQIIASLGPDLTPIVNALTTVFKQLTPIISQMATNLMVELGPILKNLPIIITPLMSIFTTLATNLLPLITSLLVQQQPALTQLGTSFGQLLQALAPVITQFGVLLTDCLIAIMPMLPPIITLIAKLSAILAGQLAKEITMVVIPALNLLTDLLSGNFSKAGKDAKTLVAGIITVIKGLPGVIVQVLSGLGTALFAIAQGMMQGFINGIYNKFGSVRSVLKELTGLLPSWKGPPATDAKLLTPNGELLIGGLMTGIANQVPALRAQLGGITTGIGGMAGTGRLGVAAGSMNRSAPAGGGSMQPIQLTVMVGGTQLGRALIDPLRKVVKDVGHGSVQVAFGTGRG